MKRCGYFENERYLEISKPNKGFIAEEPGIKVYEYGVTVNRRGEYPLFVANETNKTYKIRRGCGLGEVSPVSKVESVNLGKMSPSGEKANWSEADVRAPDQWKEKAAQMVKNNQDLFAHSDLDLSRTETVTIKIDTGDAESIRLKPYKTPLNKRKVIDKAVDDMLAAGLIKRSWSPWSFPVVVVDKKDGSKRFCVDFRRLNKITKPISYPLPLIDDILALLGRARFFASLALKQGYFQVGMDEKDKEKTAFACHRGLFQFRVMQFGLSHAPSIFVMLMSIVLQGLEDFACAYLDDILMFSETAEEHEKHIKEVFRRLREHKLKLKLPKCAFFQTETEYLGFQIETGGIKPNPEKVKAISKMPAPTTVREVRGLIGMCSYFRRFVLNFSGIAEPLIALTRKFARFRRSDECQKPFDYLKKRLTTAPLLTYPDTNKPYILYTDASERCVGAALCQLVEKDGKQEEKPIFFLSHRLSDTQTRWPTIEKEAYAIHFALQKLDQYLHNAEFVIRTDYKPLKYLLESPMKNKKIQMWALNISCYNCTINYIPGPQNVMADLLSRLPEGDNQVSESKEDSVEPEINDNTLEINAINSSRFNPKQFASYQHPARKELEKPDTQLEGFDMVGEQEKDPELKK